MFMYIYELMNTHSHIDTLSTLFFIYFFTFLSLHLDCVNNISAYLGTYLLTYSHKSIIIEGESERWRDSLNIYSICLLPFSLYNNNNNNNNKFKSPFYTLFFFFLFFVENFDTYMNFEGIIKPTNKKQTRTNKQWNKQFSSSYLLLLLFDAVFVITFQKVLLFLLLLWNAAYIHKFNTNSFLLTICILLLILLLLYTVYIVYILYRGIVDVYVCVYIFSIFYYFIIIIIYKSCNEHDLQHYSLYYFGFYY